jgi:hypothetical protein
VVLGGFAGLSTGALRPDLKFGLSREDNNSLRQCVIETAML